MNKSLHIFLAFLLFCVCGVIGYFVGKVAFGGSGKEYETKIQELPTESIDEVPTSTESSIPEIINEPLLPELNENKYDLYVVARVESGDPLLYSLKTNIEPIKEVASNSDGNFEGIAPPAKGEEYCLVVYNVETLDSVVRIIPGFERIVPRIEPITLQEIQKSLDTTSDGIVPTNLQNRFSTSQSIVKEDGTKIDGMFDQLWMDVNMNVRAYKIIRVEHNPVDNRLTKIVVREVEVK